MAILEMKEVTYKDADTTIVHDINISINPGTITSLTGEAGCGKSSVLKLMAGLIVPTHGKVYFEGTNINKMNREENLKFRKRCGFMFQDSALWANQDIFHNLELALLTHFPKMTSEQRKNKINEIVKLVGYDKPLTNRPSALSIGEQRRISFARATICNPDVLFLDEPDASLPKEALESLINLLQDYISQKKTIVFVSQDNYFISSFFCDKIYMDKGCIIKKEVLSEMLI